jgi:formylglycine-generating enzyme required for sulfatase activity
MEHRTVGTTLALVILLSAAVWLQAKSLENRTYRPAVEQQIRTEETEIWGTNPQAIPDGFIFVSGKSFTMGRTAGTGDPDELPLRTVQLSSFIISKNEISQRDWTAIMNNNPSAHTGADLPVENICWYDTIEYCNLLSLSQNLSPCYEYLGAGFNISQWPSNWKTTVHNNIICHFKSSGYRLPTEAEWEYAAKGGEFSLNTIYAGSDNLSLVGWYLDNAAWMTHIVASKAPNELGLYDMSGNVFEVVWDWYGPYQERSGKIINPTGPDDGVYKVFRSGHWQAPAYREPVSNRSCALPTSHFATYGFRVVRSMW